MWPFRRATVKPTEPPPHRYTNDELRGLVVESHRITTMLHARGACVRAGVEDAQAAIRAGNTDRALEILSALEDMYAHALSEVDQMRPQTREWLEGAIKAVEEDDARKGTA